MPRGPRVEKRPADVIGTAVMVGQIATGEVEDTNLIRASHMRELADAMNDTPSKAAMLRIAEDYERLAAVSRTTGEGANTIK